MHSKSDNIEVTAYDDGEIIEKLFYLLLSRYKIGLKIQIRRIDVIFDCVNLFYCKCHKKSFLKKFQILNHS